MRRASTEPAGHPVVARLAAELTGELGELTEQLVTMLRQADQFYVAVDIEDLRRSVWENLASFVGDLASQQPPSTSSSRDTARRRADQGVPLGSVLHAYRLGFHVIWGALADRALRKGPEWLDGLVRGSATVWAWVDTSSEAVNTEYRDALIESARKDEQQRMLLLDALLEGRRSEWKMLGGSLPAIGLPERGPYLAVSAETPGTGIENLPGAGQFLRRRGVPSAWRLRADEQVGLVAVSQDRNAHVIRDLLAEMATGRAGISPEYDDALDTGRSLGIAAVARRCLPPGSTGVASIDDDWAAALVAGAPEISTRVVHQLLGQLPSLAPAERDILLTTLRTWLECGGNASAAARQLYCHRNTVRNRLHRIETLTGHSLSDPRGVACLSIAVQGARILEQKPMHLRQTPLQQPTATAVRSGDARAKILQGSQPSRRPLQTRRLGGTFEVWPDDARCGLTCRSAAPIMAGRGLTQLGIWGRWLPVWLPGYLVSNALGAVVAWVRQDGRDVSGLGCARAGLCQEVGCLGGHDPVLLSAWEVRPSGVSTVAGGADDHHT